MHTTITHKRVRAHTHTLTHTPSPPHSHPTHTGSSYLTYVSLMNQVVMMGTQIYHDACVPQHHKYIAHQLALLYVSVCAIQVIHAFVHEFVCMPLHHKYIAHQLALLYVGVWEEGGSL